MRTWNILTKYLLMMILALSASGVVHAKVASGPQNLSPGLHQGETVFNPLTHLAKIDFSTTLTPGSPVVTKGTIDPKKFDYLFGRSTSNAHNAARSNQLALEMKRLGISDTAAGRNILSGHLDDVVRQEGNILRSFSNKHGNFEVRDSLLFGPSGKATRLESTFEIMSDGARRFVTTIPKR